MKLQKVHSGSSIDFYSIAIDTALQLPLVDGGIRAGFPSPAQDFIDLAIDLNKELIHNPSSTFYGRVNGESMKDLGINDGDLLIIDKSLEPKSGKIAVCCLDGEFTLKKIKFDKKNCWLIPANDKYETIKVSSENNFIVWGIVIHVIKSF